MSKTDDTPPGSLGVPVPGFRASILDPETGAECARAQFDESGRLLNAEEAIGEIVNPDGAGSFEGYYNNPEANAERMRGGMYWTGDLGYRDEPGSSTSRAGPATGSASTARTSPRFQVELVPRPLPRAWCSRRSTWSRTST